MPTTVDWYKQGDAEAALAKAATRIEAEYRCHYAYHAQMEPLNAVASVSAACGAPKAQGLRNVATSVIIRSGLLRSAVVDLPSQ